MRNTAIEIACALLAVLGAACEAAGDGMAMQAIAGPGGVTATVRAAGELAVSWSADPAASRYDVSQSTGGGPLTLVASVFDSSGGAPSTSYIADGLAAGVRYCYAIQAVYADGSTSDVGAPGCGVATGGRPPAGCQTITTLPLAGAAFVAADPAHPVNYAFGTALATSFEVRASVPVPVGHKILAVRATVADNASDQNAKMNLQLISINSNNTNVIASSAVSRGDGTQQVLSIAPAVTVAPHTAYQLRVYALGVPSAEDALWFAEVDYN